MAAVLIPAFILLLLLISISPSLQHLSESEPLVQFKTSANITKGDLDSWRRGTDPCNGKWFGVFCQKGRTVSGIHVTRLGLAGTIDVDVLEALTNLKTIRLDNNLLSGPLPHFFKLRSLKSLMLSNNSFTGEIPDDFFKDMLNLKRLFLDNNEFEGRIPSSVMQLPDLEELHLQNNVFTGEIPPMTDANKNFKILDVSNNELFGHVPVSISRRKNLVMNLEGNMHLCGKLLDLGCETSNGEGTMRAQIITPPPSNSNLNRPTVNAITMAIMLLLIFFIIVGVIRKRKENRTPGFRMLDKEHPSNNDRIGVKLSESGSTISAKRSKESNRKRDGSSTRKGSSKGSNGGGSLGGEIGDIIMVNSEKGSFGLPDLMKAAAEVLGNGSLGSAYKAVMTNGLTVVVKRIKEMNQLEREPFDVEMKRLGKLRHPNILTPLAYLYRREEKLVVSEYMPKSSLIYVLHDDRGINHTDLTWTKRLKIIQGVAQGMQFLHEEFASYELPHGNLKSSNVLLNDNYEPMISDYAFLPLLQPNNATQTSLFAFKAPEFAQNKQVSQKSDVYCLGIVLLEILTGKFPSQYLDNSKGGIDIVKWVQSSVAEKKEEQLIDMEIANDTRSMQQMLQLLRLGAACTASNPDERLDMRETVRKIEEVK